MKIQKDDIYLLKYCKTLRRLVTNPFQGKGAEPFPLSPIPNCAMLQYLKVQEVFRLHSMTEMTASIKGITMDLSSQGQARFLKEISKVESRGRRVLLYLENIFINFLSVETTLESIIQTVPKDLFSISPFLKAMIIKNAAINPVTFFNVAGCHTARRLEMQRFAVVWARAYAPLCYS